MKWNQGAAEAESKMASIDFKDTTPANVRATPPNQATAAKSADFAFSAFMVSEPKKSASLPVLQTSPVTGEAPEGELAQIENDRDGLGVIDAAETFQETEESASDVEIYSPISGSALALPQNNADLAASAEQKIKDQSKPDHDLVRPESGDAAPLQVGTTQESVGIGGVADHRQETVAAMAGPEGDGTFLVQPDGAKVDAEKMVSHDPELKVRVPDLAPLQAKNDVQPNQSTFQTAAQGISTSGKGLVEPENEAVTKQDATAVIKNAGSAAQDVALEIDMMKNQASLTSTTPVVAKVVEQQTPPQIMPVFKDPAEFRPKVDLSGFTALDAFRRSDGPANSGSAELSPDRIAPAPMTPTPTSQTGTTPPQVFTLLYPNATGWTEAGQLPGHLNPPTISSYSGATTPVPLASPPVPVAPEAIPAQIVTHLQSSKPFAMELILAPEELGKIRLHLTPDGDSMRVVIQAERPEAMELLRRNIDVLSSELRQSGFANTSFNFESWGGDREGPPAPKITVAVENVKDAALDVVSLNKTINNAPSGEGLDLRV